MKETRAFVISTTVSSICYWLFTIIDHRYTHGVMPNASISFFLLILLFAFAGTVLLAFPTYLILIKTKLDNNWLIIILGTLIGGIIIGYSNNGILWQHPEGFVVGFIAAITFTVLREKNA